MLKRALHTIPLASQTFSKSMVHFPAGVSPLFVSKGRGSLIVDVDGNEYIDFINGLGAVTLGYCDSDVDAAVREQMENGVTFSLPHPLEMEVAEELTRRIPCAEKVRFGKNGTDATSAAIRLARAYTGRDHVAVCGYHGWQDWYIGSTSRDLGVPESTRQMTHTFVYNDLTSLRTIFQQLSGQIAAVIMEPMNVVFPEQGFLQQVADITREQGAVFILDEMITGCRLALGGAQELFGVTPDLATFGKGLANGFPLSAVVGSGEVMDLMEEIFFSGTFGGETLSLAAARATLAKMAREEVPARLARRGAVLMEGVQQILADEAMEDLIGISGHPTFSFLHFSARGGYQPLEIKTFFLQEVFRRGILCIGSHNMSFAHTQQDVEELLSVYAEVLPLLRDAVNRGELYNCLEAKPLTPLFQVR